MLITISMINSTLSEVPSATLSRLLRSPTDAQPSTAKGDRDLDALARGLATEFPLHSMSELRLMVTKAEQDLWPRKDPIDLLDRARQRLLDGFLG